MTFEEVYQATFKEFVEHRSRSSILAYNASFAACEELQDPVKEREFFTDCYRHFKHIINHTLHTRNNKINLIG